MSTHPGGVRMGFLSSGGSRPGSMEAWKHGSKPGGTGLSTSALEFVADATGWPRRTDRILSTAWARYLWFRQERGYGRVNPATNCPTRLSCVTYPTTLA